MSHPGSHGDFEVRVRLVEGEVPGHGYSQEVLRALAGAQHVPGVGVRAAYRARCVDLGVGPEMVRKHKRRVGADEGRRTDMHSSQEREGIKELRRENKELHRTNEILKASRSRETQGRSDRLAPVRRLTSSLSAASRLGCAFAHVAGLKELYTSRTDLRGSGDSRCTAEATEKATSPYRRKIVRALDIVETAS